MTPFWAVILTTLIIGAAVHGHRYAERWKLRKRQAELLRMYAPPEPMDLVEQFDDPLLTGWR